MSARLVRLVLETLGEQEEVPLDAPARNSLLGEPPLSLALGIAMWGPDYALRAALARAGLGDDEQFRRAYLLANLARDIWTVGCPDVFGAESWEAAIRLADLCLQRRNPVVYSDPHRDLLRKQYREFVLSAQEHGENAASFPRTPKEYLRGVLMPAAIRQVVNDDETPRPIRLGLRWVTGPGGKQSALAPATFPLSRMIDSYMRHIFAEARKAALRDLQIEAGLDPNVLAAAAREEERKRRRKKSEAYSANPVSYDEYAAFLALAGVGDGAADTGRLVPPRPSPDAGRMAPGRATRAVAPDIERQAELRLDAEMVLAHLECLSTTERLVFVAWMEEDNLADWSRRNGRKPATDRGYVFDAIRKLKKAVAVM